jgi:carbonic anhydrase
MKGLLAPESVAELPAVAGWLKQAETTRRIMKENYANLEGDKLLTATVEENVLVQLENLRTHPSVAAKLAKGELRLHGWVYNIGPGVVTEYEEDAGKFLPITGAR